MPPHWLALTVLTAARTSLGFQFQSVAAASTSLVGELGLTWAQLGSLIGSYFIPGIVMALPGGALGRRFGDRNMVAVGLVLMVLGGFICAASDGFHGLAAGRITSGLGAVILNVVMSKMVTDWFAGRRDIVLAMAIFVNSFPIGIGLSLLMLGPLQTLFAWPATFIASSAFAAVAIILVVTTYKPHPNDRGGVSTAPMGKISAREAGLTSCAGLIWGIYNGAFATMFGFAPALLAASGVAVSTVGLIAGVTTWLMAGSVQVGGMMAQAKVRPSFLMAAGSFGWALALIGMAWGGILAAPAMVAAALIMGLPVGVIMSLPAQALRPENRSVGMGLFYTWLYIGHALIPPAAGWLRDATASVAAPFLISAGLVGLMPLLFGVFHMGLSVPSRTDAA